ncbi:MAG: hypothetical protein ACSHXB_20095 [Sulfitobacter sp.]
MTIITFFNPKCRSGRTTAVMAIASAILEDSQHKPAVIDMTEEVRPISHGKPSSLTVWESKMVDCGFGFDDFRVEEVQNFESMIRADCYCEVDGFTYLLVDTPRRPNDLVMNMVRRSDLVIVPFRNASEAALSSNLLAKHLKKNTLTYGLITGVDSDEEYEIAKAAFTGFPVLDNYLPNAPIFKQQREHGHLFSMERQETGSKDSTLQEMLISVMNADGRVSAQLVWTEIHTILCEDTLLKTNTKRGCNRLFELH